LMFTNLIFIFLTVFLCQSRGWGQCPLLLLRLLSPLLLLLLLLLSKLIGGGVKNDFRNPVVFATTRQRIIA